MDRAQRIRNFAIIAHIDHGKSTLADRLLEVTGAVSKREMKAQLLDSMDIERERGITIKAQTASFQYEKDGVVYTLNLIDTPGHVDFTYEVSRSLQACEGALLVVDAAQGVEAQTLANVYLALDADLEIVPVINKIDLPGADPDGVLQQIEEGIGLDGSGAVFCSAKTGIGIEEVLDAVIEQMPPPSGDPSAPLQALIVDSWFDTYVGVVVLVRVFNGTLKRGERIQLMATAARYEATKLGVFTPEAVTRDAFYPGDVGFIVASIKELRDAKVGDTVTHAGPSAATEALDGFEDVKPMVFSGVYPVDSGDYEQLRDAIEKLKLNDAAISAEPEVSDALGLGFRIGFLGLLHMEIVQERLEREYNLSLVTTAPSVVYQVTKKTGDVIEIRSPSQLPGLGEIAHIAEPISRVTIYCPPNHVGAVLKLCQERRGVQTTLDFSAQGRVMIEYDIPYGEVVFDFFDKLKSVSRGYASMDYEITRWEPDDLVKVDVLLNGELVDALSILCHREHAYYKGNSLCRKLKEFIPRQMYEVAVQAAIGSKVIARTTVKALRKDVTAKCYGGDISRKRKLLEKQKKGKKRMKAVGSVEVPQEAFLAVLKVHDD